MKKLIVITSRYPFPLDKGDKLRAFHQIKHLAKEREIHLISLTTKNVSKRELEKLEIHCASVSVFKLNKIQIIWNLFLAIFSQKPFQVAYFYSNNIHQKIKKLIRKIEPDHIYCQLIRCAEYVKDEYDIRKTLDYMDVLSKGVERRIITSPFYLKKILSVESERLKIYESVLYEYFDFHSIISFQDQELIYHTKRNNIEIIPNGIDSEYFTPDINFTKEYTLLFNGNMQYQPNVNSAIYIVKEILPLVHKINPNVNLLISGTSPTKEVLHLQSNKVKVLGWVDDIRDAYNSANIFIAPMQIGTGLQNKLLEAMAMKMPCITSKLANNALNAIPDKQILIGNSKEEYAESILKLIEDKSLNNSIAEEGQAYVNSTFNWINSTKKLAQKMES